VKSKRIDVETADEALLARMREHSLNPAFGGTFEFEIAFGMLGRRARRRIRVEWGYTPNSVILDPEKKLPGDGLTSVKIYLEPDDSSEPADWIVARNFVKYLPRELERALYNRVGEEYHRQQAASRPLSLQ
jgi:hypothetical protein